MHRTSIFRFLPAKQQLPKRWSSFSFLHSTHAALYTKMDDGNEEAPCKSTRKRHRICYDHAPRNDGNNVGSLRNVFHRWGRKSRTPPGNFVSFHSFRVSLPPPRSRSHYKTKTCQIARTTAELLRTAQRYYSTFLFSNASPFKWA